MRYPAWKYLLILVVLVISTLYALPSLYPDEPAVQISGAKAGTQIDQSVVQKAEQILKTANIATSTPAIIHAPAAPFIQGNTPKAASSHQYAHFSIKLVPIDEAFAKISDNPSLKLAQTSEIKPNTVAQSIRGATIKLAGTDIKDTSGCIRICTGIVQNCAESVIASAEATQDGIYFSNVLEIGTPITTIPKVAAEERAKA